MTLDELMAVATDRRVLAARIEGYCRHSGLPVREALDTAAHALAQRYVAGRLDFETADRLSRALFSYACVHIADMGLPAYMESVFHAFDAADDSRGMPVEAGAERYTRPRISALLSSHGCSVG